MSRNPTTEDIVSFTAALHNPAPSPLRLQFEAARSFARRAAAALRLSSGCEACRNAAAARVLALSGGRFTDAVERRVADAAFCRYGDPRG